ncbi:Lysophospholipid acyltransferase [Coemansia spiralis]|uniref:Lysophospholipid acyltransferase n=2 Tax=Coemansia TaxID=4863 RepID=A0A9W8KWQ8_9FUNG|nr:MBOAT, membrane-bound O-acyltransferase family-domain-containing protein [Coemansia spiralis]KAJ1990823.1 Lysophospholipid acyltransferase [Coemansia umbellata]KAJ2622609.1 Lysophospholipid acyltransferase [Coemansia sp. RSA 1358]KAJ2672920.1 Lysophospholipid acyltransferase [Coemansia spiralis]
MEILNRALLQISTDYLGGIPVDRITTVVAVLLSYVLAHVFRRLPSTSNGAYKHVFSIAGSIVLFGLVQEQYWGLVHLLCGALVAFALMTILRGKAMVLSVFVTAMLHMSYSQIKRQLKETALEEGMQVAFDHTGAQMVFVIKVTSLAWCIYDGGQERRTEYQRKNAIEQMPSLLEYLGYVFFFPGLAVGPAFELATYRRMVALDDLRVKRTQSRRAYAKLLEGVLWMAVYVLYGSQYTMSYMATERFAYTHRRFISRAIYMCIAGVITRAAYYTAWKMSEGACILTGLGFEGVDERGHAQWMDISNVHIRGVELGSSLKQLIDSWNIGTNTWLRHHVYLRIIEHTGGSKSTSMAAVVTFLVSAWWHGFYPGYYLTFVLGAVASNTARTLRRNLNALVALAPEDENNQRKKTIKQAYDAAGWVLSKYTLDFTVVPFMALSLSTSLRAWRAQYFVVLLAVLGIHVAFNVIGVGRCIRSHAHVKQT